MLVLLNFEPTSTHLLTVLWWNGKYEWMLHTEEPWLFQGQALVQLLRVTSWTSCLFHETPHLFARMTDIIYLFRFDYLAGIFSKMNRKSPPVSIQLIIFAANVESRAFKQNLEFWKTCILWSELDSFSIRKDFSVGLQWYVSECHFLISYNEVCSHLEYLYMLVNQYFPNDHCMVIQHHAWAKDYLKV